MKIKNKGFTLIELMITVGIFAIMTALLVAKYGTFNNGVLLTNLAYDIALNIRSAQSYGLNTRGDDSDSFIGTYSVSFEKNKKHFILTGGGLEKMTYIKRGSYIKELRVGSSYDKTSTVEEIAITFNRPDPSARISVPGSPVNYTYGEIIVSSAEGVTKKIIIQSTGQIYVSN